MATDMLVVMPWRETPDRLPAFRLAVQHWEAQGFEVEPVDSGHKNFNLAASRNAGVRLIEELGQDVAIISDADTFGDVESVYEAIDAARSSGSVHLPYTHYRSLGIDGTRQLESGLPPERCIYFPVDIACSGIYVSTPETWWSIGGMDERFTVWAPEDWAFRLAHETLIGPEVRHNGHAYAMYHFDQPSKAHGPEYAACVDLYQRYTSAHMNIEAMQLVIGGTDARI